jgi:hypothetical protein
LVGWIANIFTNIGLENGQPIASLFFDVVASLSSKNLNTLQTYISCLGTLLL